MKKATKSAMFTLIALGIALFFIFGCTRFMFGCKKNEKKIDDADVNNLDVYYLPSSTIDFDAVTLTVTYDDGSTETLKNKEYDIPDRQAASDTEFILNTDGLYDQVKAGGELKRGDYNISFSIPSGRAIIKKGFSKDWQTVTVGDNYASDLSAISYAAPELMSIHDERSDEATSGKNTEDEDKFYASADEYLVGDDNDFVFKPTLYVQNNYNGSYGTFSEYEKKFTVTLADDEGTNLDYSEYYETTGGFGVDFKSAAVGNTFKVEISVPDAFPTDMFGDPLEGFSMDVTVGDGWNVYSALDLGMMNITSSDFNRKEYVIDGDYNQQLADFFWDETEETPVTKYTDEIWAKFLGGKGYDDLSPVNGIYLHCDISITADDVPEDFMITESEAKWYSCNYDEMIGSMRDGVNLYQKYLENDDFTLGGNLFTVDCSGLKWAMTYIDTNGEFGHYKESKTDVYRGGRLSLFAVQGKVDKNIDPDTRPVATFQNLGGIGNSIDDSDVDGKEAGSYCFIDSLTSKTIVDNCHARKFLYGFRAEDSDDKYVNLTITHTKVYDCYFSAMRISRAARNEVTESDFRRFSGPAVFQMSETEERGTEQFGGYYQCGVSFDDETPLESFISGAEAWFVSSNATAIATYIELFDMLVQTCSNGAKTVLNEDGKINLKTLQHDTDDFGWGKERLNMYYCTGSNVPYVFNETNLTRGVDGKHIETPDDFGGDVSLYNAAAVNYFVDGIDPRSVFPLPLVFSTNNGTSFAVNSGYNKFFAPAYLRDNGYDALGDDEAVSMTEDDKELCVYYRMDFRGGEGVGFCIVVSIYDVDTD
ncbi:MAG: hypothetical protein LUD72_13050 [Bacteroidales bacterium]|nr:hypothetical protein [Bacteroidales bacterium]